MRERERERERERARESERERAGQRAMRNARSVRKQIKRLSITQKTLLFFCRPTYLALTIIGQITARHP
jgi:hypothetical protein